METSMYFLSSNDDKKQGFQIQTIHWTEKGRESRFLRSNWSQIKIES